MSQPSVNKNIFHDLNKFFPLFFLYSVMGVVPFGVLAVQWVMRMLGIEMEYPQQFTNYAIPIMLILSFPILFHFWKRTDSSELPITGNERDWLRGHTAVAFGNAVFILPMLFEILASLANNKQFYGFSMFAAVISIPCWLAGWGMINRSASWNFPRKK